MPLISSCSGSQELAAPVHLSCQWQERRADEWGLRTNACMHGPDAPGNAGCITESFTCAGMLQACLPTCAVRH